MDLLKQKEVRKMGEDAAALKDMAAQLAAMLQIHGEKGRDEWSKLHGELAEVAAAAGDNPITAGQALLKLTKDVSSYVSSSHALMRALEERLSKASPGLLKYLVLFVAHELNMTPLCDSEPVHMVDEYGNFCQGNVDRIINCSAELSAPNAPYAVVSIVGCQSSGKSYLLNRLFGTKFPEMDAKRGRSKTTRGIMMSRCIGPSLLLLDVEGFDGEERGGGTSFQKKVTFFLLTVSDLVIINVSMYDIGREQGAATSIFRKILQERRKLHSKGLTKILVVIRFDHGEILLEILRSDVQKSLEEIWESVDEQSLKFTEYIEVDIFVLPDKSLPEFQNKVAVLRKLLSNNRSAKVSASSFLVNSRNFWGMTFSATKPSAMMLQELHRMTDGFSEERLLGTGGYGNVYKFHQDGESIIPFRSNITSRFSSGYAEASSSTHSNNYLFATETMAMTFQELRRITDGFSEKRLLGKGGFGIVYKGVLDDGEVIAVKKLNPQQALTGVSFKNEIQNLMGVKHPNIISLIGYGEETRDRVVEYEGKLVAAVELDRAICLEYMQGGTLEKLLSDESCGLDWEARYRMIKGTCQGLKHLHTGSKHPIYHLDLNPTNILLDKDGIPKIGDFGLSKLLASTGTFVTETKSGTRGYMPPEYMHGQKISKKFDVFSLGVIIIQIIAGQEGYYDYKCRYKSPQEFIDNVTGNWRKREQAIPMLTEELLEVQKCIEMALRCVEDDRAKRPTITEVVEELNKIDLHQAPLSWRFWR